MADTCADCPSDDVEDYYFPNHSGRQESTLLCYRCALRRGAPNLDEDTVNNLVNLAAELRPPRTASPPKCRICEATEGLHKVPQMSNSGPGWVFWYCAICIRLPPAPDLNSDGLDQLLAHAQGVWNPGDPWPPRPDKEDRRG